MKTCLCCHSTLLRQIARAQVEWYCPSCRQSVPVKKTPNRLVSEYSRPLALPSSFLAHPPEAFPQPVSVGSKKEKGWQQESWQEEG